MKWGETRSTAQELDCKTPPLAKHVPVFDGQGRATPGLLGSESIAGDAVLGRHIAGLDSLVFGNATDGDFTADGSATMPGADLSSPVYTLNRDVAFSSLTINAGIVLATNGYRLFAQYLRLNGSAVVHNDGSAGFNGAQPAAGAGGAGGGVGSISYAASAGAPGGQGGSTTPSPGGKGGFPYLLNPIGGGGGGQGASGTDGSLGKGAGGDKNFGQPTTTSFRAYPKIVDLFDNRLVRGIGGGNGGSGGGGGGGGTTGVGGGGGGGGGGAGVCLVVTATIDTASGGWSGRISANGGDGGAGAAHAGNGGDGGGGGGGGGGLAILLARKIVGSVAVSTDRGITVSAVVQARGGSLGGGNQTSGSPGDRGTALVLALDPSWSASNVVGRVPILEARPLRRRELRVGTRDVIKPH